jgi:hypothetical protein
MLTKKPFVKAVASVPSQHSLILSALIPLYCRLSQDDQDSVRLLTIPDLIALASALTPAETKDHLADPLRQTVIDKSWRVRYMMATEFVGLAEAIGEGSLRDELVTAFVGLLKDNEAEVRTAAAGQIPGTLLRCESGDCGMMRVQGVQGDTVQRSWCLTEQASPSWSTGKSSSLVSCPASRTSRPTRANMSALPWHSRFRVSPLCSAKTPLSSTYCPSFWPCSRTNSARCA